MSNSKQTSTVVPTTPSNIRLSSGQFGVLFKQYLISQLLELRKGNTANWPDAWPIPTEVAIDEMVGKLQTSEWHGEMVGQTPEVALNVLLSHWPAGGLKSAELANAREAIRNARNTAFDAIKAVATVSQLTDYLASEDKAIRTFAEQQSERLAKAINRATEKANREAKAAQQKAEREAEKAAKQPTVKVAAAAPAVAQPANPVAVKKPVVKPAVAKTAQAA